MSYESLELMKEVVVKDFSFVLLVVFNDPIVDTENIVAEGRRHKELLHHAVHIADAPEVSQTYVLLKRCALAGWLVVPLVGLLDHLEKGT